MVASSILPVSIHNGELYFLFGKENQMEDSAKGFSDFGGRVEPGESIMKTAYREGSEELCGFLGDSGDIQKLIKKNGGVFKHSHNDYHVHIFAIPYDDKLPHYYNNHYKFVWNRMDKNILNNSKFYEKQEIQWFSVKELTSKRNEFRSFYREIIDELKQRCSEIEKFIRNKSYTSCTCKKYISSHKTRKHMGLFQFPRSKGG